MTMNMMLLENCVRNVALALLLLESNIMKSLVKIMGIALVQQTAANFLQE